MAHTKREVAYSGYVTDNPNTYSYSGSFDVFKETEVEVELDNIALTYTASTINESASPREYTVDTAAKTIHIGGGNLSSGTIIIRPVTDMGAPTPRATYTPGASITSEDLNNNQKQLMRKAMEYDEQKLSSTGGTMTGHLTIGEDQTIIFEGATDNAYETTLTVADPTADRTVTIPNTTGTVITTGDTQTVATGMIADDAVTNDKLANSIVSAISANTAKTTNATHTGDVTGATSLTIANDAVTSAKIDDGTIVTGNISASAAIDFTKLENLDSAKILVGNSSNKAAEVAVSGDLTLANTGAFTIAPDAVEIGMIGCEQTTISDSDSHIPTSGAVVDYVASALLPFGGFETIADEDNFPATPAAGVVISISDAGGVQFNGSGQATNARTAGNGSDNVTINGAPSSLYNETLAAGVGLMVTSTGSSNTYNYHKILGKEADIKELSDDINDFKERYKVHNFGSGDPSNPDEGDLAFDTNANKMKVYDGSAWGEVASTGEFKFLVPVNPGTTTAADWGNTGLTNGNSGTSWDLRESTNTGSAAAITSALQLLVSVNGVIQKANTGSWSGSGEGFYRESASRIRFATAPAAGSSVFVIQIGAATTLNVPADNSVSGDKIALGSDAAGDIMYYNGTDYVRLPKGTNGHYLKQGSSNAPEWSAVASTPTDITVADESSDTTCFPLFVTAATGDLAPKSGSNLTFNSNTGALAATSFSGDGSALTGVSSSSANGTMWKNTLTISNDHTIAANEGAHSVGPITNNATVTVNGRWVIS